MAKVSVQTLIETGADLAAKIDQLERELKGWVNDCKDSIPEGAKADVEGFLPSPPFPESRVTEDLEVRKIVCTYWGIDADFTRKGVDVLIAFQENGIAKMANEVLEREKGGDA